MANPTGKGLKPFKKGQSGNPGGRPKGAAPFSDWRRRNSQRLQALLTDEDIDNALLRWWARFVAGSRDALWIKDEILEPIPKPVAPDSPADEQVREIVIKRFEKKTSGDGDPGGD